MSNTWFLFCEVEKFEKILFCHFVYVFGDEDHELGGEAEVFFYIGEKVLEGVHRYPDRVFEAGEARFFQEIAEGFAFAFALFRQIKQDNPPEAVPGRRDWCGAFFA